MVDLVELAHIIGGIAINLEYATATRIVFDSREVKSGDLFWALKGNNIDGNSFINDAIIKGATAVVTDKVDFKGPSIIVDDTYRGLVQYAKYKRKTFEGTVVAITGSNGKTTTRRYISGLLKKWAPVLEPPKNYNNEFGVPMNMSCLDNSYRYYITELGGAKRGDILFLSELVCPHVAVLTSIGKTHLEFLKSLENVFRMKMEIIEGMKNGTLIVNSDDPFLTKLPETVKGQRVLKFSMKDKEVFYYFDGKTFYKCGEKVADISGEAVFNKMSLGLAMAVADLLNYKVSGYGAFEVPPIPGRFEIIKKDKSIFINDAYNSNPDSLKYGLKRLNEYLRNTSHKKRILVLGDMLELGPESLDLHRGISATINEVAADVVILIGQYMPLVEVKAPRILKLQDISSLSDVLDRELAEGSVVYFKASNAVGLFDFVKKYIGEVDVIPSFVSIT